MSLVLVVSYSISTSNHNLKELQCESDSLYLIPFLHQTTTDTDSNGSVISCILFHFYIKPQPILIFTSWFSVVSYSISTSNHNLRLLWRYFPTVVSYSISTSNHNRVQHFTRTPSVVSYSISTSNHNRFPRCPTSPRLYLIPFLHQTTTPLAGGMIHCRLYLIPFLHQTTTSLSAILISVELYLIPFLHQTTTEMQAKIFTLCCILFHFYIKPQLYYTAQNVVGVVSYSISTSNHNKPIACL